MRVPSGDQFGKAFRPGACVNGVCCDPSAFMMKIFDSVKLRARVKASRPRVLTNGVAGGGSVGLTVGASRQFARVATRAVNTTSAKAGLTIAAPCHHGVPCIISAKYGMAFAQLNQQFIWHKIQWQR